MAGFPNVRAYCQTLKMLADQLANIGSSVSNQRQVLQIVAGFMEAYNDVASIIHYRGPLPLSLLPVPCSSWRKLAWSNMQPKRVVWR